MRTFFTTTLLALVTTTCALSFNAPLPHNQYYIPGIDNDKRYALIHLTSNDESFATCDTMLLINFMNMRQLDFVLDVRPKHTFEKILLTDGLVQWESSVFKSSDRNILAYRVKIVRGELIVSRTYLFFLRSFAQFLGAIFILLFVLKGLFYWVYFRGKTKYIMGRFTAAQVNASLLISIGLVFVLSLLGSYVSTVIFVALMFVAALLMFLSELKKLSTSILTKDQQFSLILLSNLLWFLVATYPLMLITPSL